MIDKKDKNLSYFIIDKALYSPIEQALITTKNGANNPLAKVFKDFYSALKPELFLKNTATLWIKTHKKGEQWIMSF